MFNTAEVATARDWPALAEVISAHPETRWVSSTVPPVGAARWALRLGVDDFATHRVPLTDAPHAYEMFQRKEDGAVKVIMEP